MTQKHDAIYMRVSGPAQDLRSQLPDLKRPAGVGGGYYIGQSIRHIAYEHSHPIHRYGYFPLCRREMGLESLCVEMAVFIDIRSLVSAYRRSPPATHRRLPHSQSDLREDRRRIQVLA